MDRTTDPFTKIEGASFTAGDTTQFIRTTDNALLQTEAVAIMSALTHASRKGGYVFIYMDSKAAIDCLQQGMPIDSNYTH